MSKVEAIVHRLNERFRNGRPSSNLAEAGVVMHQFDNFEDKQKPWLCQMDGKWDGRVSAMIAFRRMKDRHDRDGVPLINWGGGVVVDPRRKIKCCYGDDASTYLAQRGYGCYTSYCDRNHPFAKGNWGKPCGFGPKESFRTSWHAQDLDKMLELYVHYSQPYRSPQWYSGYNEVIYGYTEWNNYMPNTVEAFFTIAGDHVGSRDYGYYQKFLTEYRVAKDDIPFLKFDPDRWDGPFRALSLP